MRNRNLPKGDMIRMAKLQGCQVDKKYTDSAGNIHEFIFQHPGIRNAIKIRQVAYNLQSGMDLDALYGELMKKVIYKKGGGKVNWEFIEEHSDFSQELLNDANNFLDGKNTME